MLLESSARRRQLLALVSLLAVGVVLWTIHTIMRPAAAMVHQEEVLDCHYDGDGAHVHNADCYDSGTNLVCPLPLKEPHKHDEDCYVETYELTCGMEEGEDHVHTDDCYEIEYELVCDLEETTEEHIHGPGCFKTVMVDSEGNIVDEDSYEELSLASEEDEEYVEDEALDGAELEVTADGTEGEEGEEDAEAGDDAESEDDASVTEDEPEGENPAEADSADEGSSRKLVLQESGDDEEADESMPAQLFHEQLPGSKREVPISVLAIAPSGAFPAGTTMRVERISSSTVEGAVQQVVGDDVSSASTQIHAVDIRFYDADGNEIEPAREITVSISSDQIADGGQAMLVHVDSDGKGELVDTLSADELAERHMNSQDDELVFEAH